MRRGARQPASPRKSSPRAPRSALPGGRRGARWKRAGCSNQSRGGQRLCRGLGNARRGSRRGQLPERLGKRGTGALDGTTDEPLHRGRGGADTQRASGGAHSPHSPGGHRRPARRREGQRAGCHRRSEVQTGPSYRRAQPLDEGDGPRRNGAPRPGRGCGALGTGSGVERGEDVPTLTPGRWPHRPPARCRRAGAAADTGR